MSDFREKISELIEYSGKPLSELARISGIAQSKLSNWTRYDVIPETKSLIQIVKYFNCSLDFLIGISEIAEAKFNNNPVSFSGRLQALIKEKNKTPYRICKELHLNTGMMSGWVNQGKLPDYENLIALAYYFNCSADYLLGLSDNR